MFVVIDGPDGSGKTSLARLLVERLSKSRETVYTAEPTDTPLGMRIREILRDGSDKERLGLADMFLRDRAAHINRFIKPELAKGKTVVCDRYKYSTVCYQRLQGMDTARLIALNKAFLKPDYAFILYVMDVDVLAERIANRNKASDFFESKALMTRAIDIYGRMRQYFPDENIRLLDASKPLEDMADAIIASID